MSAKVLETPEIINQIYKRKTFNVDILQKTLKEGDHRISCFSQVMAEVWKGLFFVPDLSEDVKNPTKDVEWAVKAIATVRQNNKYQKLKHDTSGNPFTSTVALYEFASSLIKKLPDQTSEANPKKIEKLREEVGKYNSKIKALQQKEKEDQSLGKSLSETEEKKLKSQKQKRSELIEEGKKLVEKLADFMLQVDIEKALTTAISEAQEGVSKALELASAFGWSEDDNSHGQDEYQEGVGTTGSMAEGKIYNDESGIEEKFRIYQQVKKNRNLLRIIKEAGRFKKICKSLKQKTIATGETMRRGIEYGKTLRKIIPQEIMLLATPQTKPIFMKKLADDNLKQYKTVEKTKLNSGNVFLFCDYSSSTEGDKNVWISAVTWAIAHTINKQNRAVSIVIFNNKLVETFDFAPGQMAEKDLIAAVNRLPSGGTYWECAINHGIELVKKTDIKSKFTTQKNKKHYDFILITDGENSNNANWQKWVKDFNQFKKDYGVSLYGVLVGTQSKKMIEISDRIIDINDLNSDEQATELLKVID